MIEKRRVVQPLNLIIFLVFLLAGGVTVCLPFFEGADMLLQLAWTGYLLAGIMFLFFVGEKAAKAKIIEKYLINTKAGRFLTSCLWFLLCIGCGGGFRIWQMSGGIGGLNKNTLYNFIYYFLIGLFVYLTVRQISGFRSSAAAVVLMTLCPFFDFSAKLSTKDCAYTLLILMTVLFISFANYFVEKKSVSLQDTLLTILGAVSLAGATFLHISSIILVFPCIFLLIRKSGLPVRGKREQRGLRSLLFEIFYICSLVVIFLIYSVNKGNTKIIEIPLDYDLMHIFEKIGKEPMEVLQALFDKFSRVFIIRSEGEYYNGLLLGMLILGIAGVILLFRKRAERRYFPVYLFNWYFFFSIFLKEFAAGGLILYILLVCVVSGVMTDLSEFIFAGKKQKQKEPEAEELEEMVEEEPEELEEPQTEQQLQTEEMEETEELTPEEEQKLKQKLEMEAALKGAEKKLPEPIKAEPREAESIEEAEPPEAEIVEEPETAETAEDAETAPEETVQEEAAASSVQPLKKQIEDLIRREDRILEIVEKQSAQISRLEEELREQRIRTKKMEHHYRKELAIARNKKR